MGLICMRKTIFFFGIVTQFMIILYTLYNMYFSHKIFATPEQSFSFYNLSTLIKKIRFLKSMQYNNLQNRKNEKSIETKLMNKKLINVNIFNIYCYII